MQCSGTTWAGDTVEDDRVRDKRVYAPPARKAIDAAVEAGGRKRRAHFAAAWRHALGIGEPGYKQLRMPTTAAAQGRSARRQNEQLRRLVTGSRRRASIR